MNLDKLPAGTPQSNGSDAIAGPRLQTELTAGHLLRGSGSSYPGKTLRVRSRSRKQFRKRQNHTDLGAFAASAGGTRYATGCCSELDMTNALRPVNCLASRQRLTIRKRP